MKLIGLLINDFNDLIKRSQIIFDSNVNINFSNYTLEVILGEDQLSNFYGNNISNITAIIGNNGSGKTSILDIIATSDEERKKFLNKSSYCLIFLKDDLLYLEMHNFSINNVIFLNTNTQLNLKNYTGHYTIGSNSIEDLFTIYYFQLTKSVAQSNVQTDIIKRVYKNSKQLSISDATSKYKAYELLVTEGFFPENADYKWLIKVDTYDKLIDYITDYCFRKMLPLDSMYEHNLKEIIWNYIDPTYESHIIDNGNSEDLSIFLKDNISFFESFNRFKNKEYNDDLEFEDDRIRDEFNKQFNIAISNYKKNVSIRRFNFIFKPFFQNESKQELTFKELQILNCLIDTYTYIRDLYFPNYNKESEVVKQWEHICGIVVIYFKQLLNPEFIIDNTGEFVGDSFQSFCEEFSSSDIYPKDDIGDYINFTARFLRQFYKINSTLISEDKCCSILDLKIDNKSVDDFIKELNRKIDFEESRKVKLINERKLVSWFKMTEVTSRGEQNLLDITTLINFLSEKLVVGESLIVIDEIEDGLHLEWTRRLLHFLINKFNMVPNHKFQLIFTTHSPFMLSDIKSGNVIALVKDNTNGLTSIQPYKNTFAKNIQEIMHDDMFIKDIYGEFAIYRINTIIKDLNSHQEPICNLSKKKLLSEIDMISEPLLRNKLYEMYERKFKESTVDNRIEQLKLELEKLESKRRNQ